MLRPNGICVHNIIRQKASRFVNCLPFQCRRPMRNCHCSIDACRHMMYWSWLPLLSGQALLHSSTEIPTVHESRSHGGPVKCFQNLSDERVTKVSKKTHTQQNSESKRNSAWGSWKDLASWVQHWRLPHRAFHLAATFDSGPFVCILWTITIFASQA